MKYYKYRDGSQLYRMLNNEYQIYENNQWKPLYNWSILYPTEWAKGHWGWYELSEEEMFLEIL